MLCLYLEPEHTAVATSAVSTTAITPSPRLVMTSGTAGTGGSSSPVGIVLGFLSGILALCLGIWLVLKCNKRHSLPGCVQNVRNIFSRAERQVATDNHAPPALSMTADMVPSITPDMAAMFNTSAGPTVSNSYDVTTPTRISSSQSRVYAVPDSQEAPNCRRVLMSPSGYLQPSDIMGSSEGDVTEVPYSVARAPRLEYFAPGQVSSPEVQQGETSFSEGAYDIPLPLTTQMNTRDSDAQTPRRP